MSRMRKVYPWSKLCCSDCGCEEEATWADACVIDIDSFRCPTCEAYRKGMADALAPRYTSPEEAEAIRECWEKEGRDAAAMYLREPTPGYVPALRRIARANKRGVTFGVVCGPCAYCGDVWSGSYAIHRDGFGKGPEVPICDHCGVGRGAPERAPNARCPRRCPGRGRGRAGSPRAGFRHVAEIRPAPSQDCERVSPEDRLNLGAVSAAKKPVISRGNAR